MKTVSVGFTHMTRLSNGKPATTSSTVICEDDVDKYEIMTLFEGAIDFGWVVSSVQVVKQGERMIRIDPTF